MQAATHRRTPLALRPRLPAVRAPACAPGRSLPRSTARGAPLQRPAALSIPAGWQVAEVGQAGLRWHAPVVMGTGATHCSCSSTRLLSRFLSPLPCPATVMTCGLWVRNCCLHARLTVTVPWYSCLRGAPGTGSNFTRAPKPFTKARNLVRHFSTRWKSMMVAVTCTALLVHTLPLLQLCPPSFLSGEAGKHLSEPTTKNWVVGHEVPQIHMDTPVPT